MYADTIYEELFFCVLQIFFHVALHLPKATLFGMLCCSWVCTFGWHWRFACCLIASSARSLMLHLVRWSRVMVLTPERYCYQRASIENRCLRQTIISSWDVGLFELSCKTMPLFLSLGKAVWMDRLDILAHGHGDSTFMTLPSWQILPSQRSKVDWSCPIIY